jgi:ankyrin repeat protein
LIKSSIKGDYDKVKYCLDKKANINYVDRKKWTAFVWASCNGHIEILKLLIERGGAV